MYICKCMVLKAVLIEWFEHQSTCSKQTYQSVEKKLNVLYFLFCHAERNKDLDRGVIARTIKVTIIQLLSLRMTVAMQWTSTWATAILQLKFARKVEIHLTSLPLPVGVRRVFARLSSTGLDHLANQGWTWGQGVTVWVQWVIFMLPEKRGCTKILAFKGRQMIERVANAPKIGSCPAYWVQGSLWNGKCVVD